MWEAPSSSPSKDKKKGKKKKKKNFVSSCMFLFCFVPFIFVPFFSMFVHACACRRLLK